jgi:hypothetical protein
LNKIDFFYLKKEEEETKENNADEDHNLQETLNRVKIEEQIMRVEEIVSLYKVNLTIKIFFY